MRLTLNQIIDNVPPARKALAVPALALKTVTSRGGKSVYASSDTLFRGAVFGRDSLEVAEDLMKLKSKLVRNILIRLAELQGVNNKAKNEEEIGKIIHEYRTITIDGRLIDKTSQRIFYELAEKWGGNKQELAYYGSVDATPHFLRTLDVYCSTYGNEILDHEITKRNGQKTTMRQTAHAAITWLTAKLGSSASGLIEYKRLNPRGIPNQVWKDSEEFYVHLNKQRANHNGPIASIEVQALGYDALMAAGRFFPDDAARYRELASQLRDKTIKLLWQDDQHYFALGTDYDATDELRIISTETANPAALLDSAFFDDLPQKDRQKYVTAIANKIMSKDFLTAAGVRSRSLAAAQLINFWDYHGSYVSWPKETYDIAKGLRRQGLPKLADQLENRLLNIVLKTHEYPEFVYVDEWGRVLTARPARRMHGQLIVAHGTNTPERLQAWTVSAVMAIIAIRLNKKLLESTKTNQKPWQKALEETIMARIPHMDRYINPFKLFIRYPTHRYKLSTDKKG